MLLEAVFKALTSAFLGIMGKHTSWKKSVSMADERRFMSFYLCILTFSRGGTWSVLQACDKQVLSTPKSGTRVMGVPSREKE